MKSSIFFVVGAIAALSGCATATFSEPLASDSKGISFPLDVSTIVENQVPLAVRAQAPTLSEVCAASPAQVAQWQAEGLPASFTLPTESTSTTFDFSSALSSIKSVADKVVVTVTGLSLDNSTGSLDLVSSAEVDITGVPASQYPQAVLATYTASTSGATNTIGLNVQLDSATLLSYLESGAVTITVEVMSNPVTLSKVCSIATLTSLSSTVDMSVSASGTFSKSL